MSSDDIGSAMAEEQYCPTCYHMLDMNTPLLNESTSAVPKPQDISLCIYCGNWSVFDDDLKLRKPEPDMLREIMSDPDCVKAQKAWGIMFSR
jgi:hypothetical protein